MQKDKLGKPILAQRHPNRVLRIESRKRTDNEDWSYKNSMFTVMKLECYHPQVQSRSHKEDHTTMLKTNPSKENLPDCLFWYWDEKKHMRPQSNPKPSGKSINFNKLSHANSKKRLELKNKCKEDIQSSIVYEQYPSVNKGIQMNFPETDKSKHKKIQRSSVTRDTRKASKMGRVDSIKTENIRNPFCINAIKIESKSKIPFGQENYTLHISQSEHFPTRPASAAHTKVVAYSRSNSAKPKPTKRPQSYHVSEKTPCVDELFITAK